jgi:anti-sigma B factor antagonist
METNLTQSGDVKILNIAGSLDTNTAPELENEVNAILDTKVERLIFDLKDLAYVSSSGLRVFLMTAKKLMPNKGKLYLAAPNDTVKEILKVSGFDSIIPVSKDVEEALEKINF